MEYLLIQLSYGIMINKYGGLKMTTNDIEKAEILLCFKNGERAVGVTDDKILLNFIVQYVKFLQLDEEKMGTVSLPRNNQKSTRKQKSYDRTRNI